MSGSGILLKTFKHTDWFPYFYSTIALLVQNAEDNQYPVRVNPTLEFIITSTDITATGAAATLLIFNNEKGFSRQNIESICSVGRSTKKGNRSSGYIGEKGIFSHLNAC
jgi:hypothetical protein